MFIKSIRSWQILLSFLLMYLCTVIYADGQMEQNTIQQNLYGKYVPYSYQTTQWKQVFPCLDKGKLKQNEIKFLTGSCMLFIRAQAKIWAWMNLWKVINQNEPTDKNVYLQLPRMVQASDEVMNDISDSDLKEFRSIILDTIKDIANSDLIKNVPYSQIAGNGTEDQQSTQMIALVNKIKKGYNVKLHKALRNGKLSKSFGALYKSIIKNENLLYLLLRVDYGLLVQVNQTYGYKDIKNNPSDIINADNYGDNGAYLTFTTGTQTTDETEQVPQISPSIDDPPEYCSGMVEGSVGGAQLPTMTTTKSETVPVVTTENTIGMLQEDNTEKVINNPNIIKVIPYPKYRNNGENQCICFMYIFQSSPGGPYYLLRSFGTLFQNDKKSKYSDIRVTQMYEPNGKPPLIDCTLDTVYLGKDDYDPLGEYFLLTGSDFTLTKPDTPSTNTLNIIKQDDESGHAILLRNIEKDDLGDESKLAPLVPSCDLDDIGNYVYQQKDQY